MNISNEINEFIQKYEYRDFSSISFGEVLYYLVRDNDLMHENEEYYFRALQDLKEEWLADDIIRETTSVSTLESMFKKEAKTVEDIKNIVSEEFEIFDVTIEKHEMYKHRFEIIYYRNPDYCETRHYIKVTLLTKEDLKTIKKILNIRKGV